MSFFALLLSLLFSCCFTKQTIIANDDVCKSSYDTLTNQVVYVFVDEIPEYQGGTKEMLKFFFDNFKYPKQDFFQGSIYLEFIIDIQGNVTGQKIRNKNTEELTEVDKEALRVLSLMPQWKPGKCKGEIVPVRTYIPLNL
jgi:hypothetical protein